MKKKNKKIKKKLVILILLILVGTVLFLSVNHYLLNKNNINNEHNDYLNNKNLDSSENSNNNDNKDLKDNNDTISNEVSEKNKSEDQKEDNNKPASSSDIKDNSNNNASSINSAGKDTTNNSTNKEIILKKDYPALEKISGSEKTIGKTKNGFIITEIAGVTYIDGIMMVNKTYGLPSTYMPVNTVESAEGKTTTCNKCINKIAYSSFNKMQADAKALGLNIYIASGYRPYVGQESIYNRYIKRDGKDAADTYSARPGYSEHQTSYSFDLNSINDSFAKTDEGKWVNNNAYLYGFIIRFPKNKSEYTGYKYESWHLRYVGYDLAKKIYNNGDWLSLEEYFGVDSKYQD